MNTKIVIEDLYAGKPDAKDEINTESFDDFIESFVLPENLNLSRLTEKNDCFITGYKGTGKTSLLFFVDNKLRDSDTLTCSSFIFFKEEFTESKRKEFEELSKRLLSSISIKKDILLAADDFEYIWKWILFKRIVDDNEINNNGLFIDNEDWKKFKHLVYSINGNGSKKKINFPAKFKFSIPIHDAQNGIRISPEAEVDLSNAGSSEALITIIDTIEEAENIFSNLKRSDIPYYIFIDELEAYMSEQSVFLRDLKLIRDLVFTVKKINNMFININRRDKSKTKIICSIRNEIINSISRFIVTKEINKIISGFELPIIWYYSNTNSIRHPIFKVLLKRIEMAYKNKGIENHPSDIYKEWFPDKIDGIEPVQYILDNGWNKPRDIVRLIMTAQNSLNNIRSSFSKATLEDCRKLYSKESLKEIKEEMLALYNPNDIDSIFQCLSGFKTIFSKAEIKKRISIHFPNSFLENDLNKILGDLYRLGVIGNYSRASRSHRWQHKGDDEIIISDEWSFMVHQALQNALSLRKMHDKAVEKFFNKDNLSIGDKFNVVITYVSDRLLFVEFMGNENIQSGVIHASKLPNYVSPLSSFYSKGTTLSARICGYNNDHGNWEMTLK